MIEEKYMIEAIKEAKKALKNGDVPVGAVIVYDNKIIAKACNQKEMNKSAISHAEIIAIDEACKKLNTWHLTDCEIYVTMEPCIMCMGAIMESIIKKIVYGVANEKFGLMSNLKNDSSIKSRILKNRVVVNMENNDIKQMLRQFFEIKRI